MAKIITKEPINWGGFDPTILNKVSIEIREMSKTESGIQFRVTDNVLIEHIEEMGNYTTVLCTPRSKTLNISVEQYNTLFLGAIAYIDAVYPEYTQFQRDSIIKNVALLLYVQNDKIGSGKCAYDTLETDWEIC